MQRITYVLVLLRRRKQSAFDRVVSELAASPERWDELRPLVLEAARVGGVEDAEREGLALRYWRTAVTAGRLTVEAEKVASQITAGLSVRMDILASDGELTDAAIVGRARDGRFPTPVPTPRLPGLRADEIVHLEFPARAVEYRDVTELRGSAWGVAIPLGHYFSFVVPVVDAKAVERSRGEVVDSGAVSVTDQRLVYWGAQRAYDFGYTTIAAFRRKPHSLAVMSTTYGHVVELIVPYPDAIAAVINLQMFLTKGGQPAPS